VKGVEFSNIRQYLSKSQAQMARLLGVSLRAVQSYEQGWRNVPVSIERQILFLLSMKVTPILEIKPCWQKKECDPETRNKCPAWEFQAGHICWFINGTICDGKFQESWNRKIQLCRQCAVFRSLFPAFSGVKMSNSPIN